MLTVVAVYRCRQGSSWSSVMHDVAPHNRYVFPYRLWGRGATGSASGHAPPIALLAARGRRWIGPARPAGQLLESPELVRIRKPLCPKVSETIPHLSP